MKFCRVLILLQGLLFVVGSFAVGECSRAQAPAKEKQTLPSPAERVPAHAKVLIGCWQNEEDNDRVIRFSAKKCYFARLGGARLRIAKATYEPGKIVSEAWGKKTVYKYEFMGDRLILIPPQGKPEKYRKLARTPAELEVRPLKLGSAGDLPKKEIDSIKGELARRARLDQKVRSGKVQRNELAKVDADNTKFLVQLVQRIGWIDATRFGAAASNHAFLIVQHSGHLPLMLAALPQIEKDVKAKLLDPQPYALLFDRVQLSLGEKQRFGTQIGRNDKGQFVVLPLQDRQRVEQFRKEIGLFPLSVYLKILETQTGGKPIAFADDE
ncbi:MAG: hypothetical protein KatS3mg105_1560 [Gemmatales bacterium]|nr:MAG: hypothetical protein KatS3mg105_1560 [Gemmatales bacterium]